jgi:hypothetical protein
VTRREALLIRSFCAWTVYVWVTRIWNILGDDTRSSGFKAVHSVLALISIAFAVFVWRAVHRIRLRDRAGARDE